MAEGIFEDTVEATENHPYLILGSVGAVVLIIYFMRSKSSAGQNFSFSYGPSDAAIISGNQLTASQQADNAALSIANTNAKASEAVYGDYFGYLAGDSSNRLAATKNTNASAVAINANTNQYAGIMNASNNTAKIVASNDALAAIESSNSTKQVLGAQQVQLGTTESNNATSVANGTILQRFQAWLQSLQGAVNQQSGAINQQSAAINAQQAAINSQYASINTLYQAMQ